MLQRIWYNSGNNDANALTKEEAYKALYLLCAGTVNSGYLDIPPLAGSYIVLR